MNELIRLENLSKTFAGVTVLSEVELTVQEGEIHALLGQNGSGKSTLIKILSGFHAPDTGARMWMRGQPVSLPLDPGSPLQLGVAFVHQDLGLADDMSLVDNLSVGEYRRHWGGAINWRAQEADVANSLREFGVEDDVRQDLSRLSSPAKRALVAITRAVTRIRRQHGGGLLVLDEPTVYLPRREVEHLQDVVRRLARSGVGVLYVTHRLDELQSFADRATVLRDGRRVGEVDLRTSSSGSGLVEMITGSKIDFDEFHPSHTETGVPPVLTVDGLAGGRVEDVSFEVRPGEIIGLAGLVGMGQDDVLALTFGATQRTAGQIRVAGSTLRPDPHASIQAGMAFLPPDRPRRSAAVSESVAHNVTLPVLAKKFFRRGRLQSRRELDYVSKLMDEYDIKPRNPLAEMARLSGGNQQKALLAKWLQTVPKVLLLDEPVQGVDVGAKAAIFDQLRIAAASGCALVIASSEYDDLALLCDRVLVFLDGRIHRVLSGGQITKTQIASACYGTPVGKEG